MPGSCVLLAAAQGLAAKATNKPTSSNPTPHGNNHNRAPVCASTPTTGSRHSAAPSCIRPAASFTMVATRMQPSIHPMPWRLLCP